MHLLSNDEMHEQFSIMCNVFPNCFGFALLCLMIGLENLRPPYKSIGRENAIATLSITLCWASNSLSVIILSPDG